MSSAHGRGAGAAQADRARLSVLDRLLDENPEQQQDARTSPIETLSLLRSAVRRDLEALLNARRPWRSWPEHLRELESSPYGWGVPDLLPGMLSDPKRREAYRAEIEATIRRFEPRLMRVAVAVAGEVTPLDATLRLRIDALLHADPAPEPVAFNTVVDPGMSEVTVEAAPDV